MKNIRFLLIALVALSLSACTSLLSSAEEAPTTRNNNRQIAQDNRQTTTAPAADASPDAASATTAAPDETGKESEGDRKLENTFAGLDENGEDNSQAPPPQPEATKKPASATTTGNAVCPHPDKPCKHKDKEFAEWELSFRLPAKIAANKPYSSAPFYAVMVKTMNSAEDCDGGEFHTALEDERKQIQSLEPERKVFASYMCPNMDSVDYDFKGKMDASGERVAIENFIAVYAGETEEEAETLRRSLRDEYPQAVVKRMTARWERIVQ